MDFLLSFRLHQDPKKIKISKPFISKGLYQERTPLIKFLLLSVDNNLWKFLQLQGICCRFFITTYTIGFHSIEKGFLIEDGINTLLDLFYLIDLISAIIYRVKWPKSNLQLKETSPYLERLIWRNYLYRPRRIWMIVVDVISLIPFEIVRIWVPYFSSIHAITHCAPALRIYRLPVYYASEFKTVSFKVHTLLDLFLRVGILWAIMTHTLTCLWKWLSHFNVGFNVENFSKAIIFDDSKPIHWYLIIHYFIQIGFTNIGFGDIVPDSDAERAVTILVMVMGFIMLCGYLIAALSSVLAEKARRLTYLHLRLSLMSFELDQRKVPEAVSKKIIKFYYSLWASRKGIGPTNNLLLSLPDVFASQVYYDIFRPALNASLLFKSCDEYSKRAIARVMRVHLYMAGDVILKRREVNSKMFFIRKGTIQIMSFQDDETEVMTFGAGSVFGQFSLIISLPAKSEIHAATFCEIHVINRKSLFGVLKDYPSAKETVFSVHKNLLLNVLADKRASETTVSKPENLLAISNFYKVPVETSKLARDDICIVTKFPYVYMPDTIFLKIWNTMVAILIVIICFYYPYHAGFERVYPYQMEPFIILVDVVLWFNFYLTISTAFVRENILLSSFRDVAAVRIGTVYTFIDFASILPIHYFLDNVNRLKPVILCLRCLLFYKLSLLFRAAEYTAGPNAVFMLHLLKYILYFLYGAYVMGIVYYAQACYTDPCLPDSWYVKFGNITKDVDHVWVSVYFATLVMTGTGFGDITVSSVRDILYVITFAVFGVLLFIYLIADYSANLSLIREPRKTFIELAERVNSFLLGQKMLTSERTRVRQFLNLQWERSQGYEFTSNQGLFYDTPNHLLYEANQYTRSRGFHKIELFKGMGEAIIGSILDSSFRKVFPPHEVVIYAGEICNYLMIIEEGYCEVTYGRDVTVTKIYRAGQDICTFELMLGLTALCHVRTLTHCTILKVSKTSILRALALNPIAAREIDEAVVEFKNSQVIKDIEQKRPIRLHLTVRSTIQKSLYRFRYYRKQGGNRELREPYNKLGLCQWIKYLLRSTTVLPYGKFLKRWELSRCVFAFFSAILFPCLPYFQLEFPFLFYVGIMLDVTAWIDIYFRLHVCYYNNKNVLVSHPLWTCGHYIRGNFVIDFIFCFPFDRIMYRRVYDINNEYLVTGHSINMLRMLRVGQIYRIPTTLNTIAVDFLTPPSLFLVIVATTAFTTVYINFLTSILILMTVNYKADNYGNFHIVIQPYVEEHFETLLNIFQFPTLPSYIFILNYYWTAVTAFGVGFGDIKAETNELMIFVIIVIIISYLYFNYVTVTIASYLTSINMNLTIFQKRMSHLTSYLKAENVEPLLRKHIVNHFEYLWKKNKGMKAQFVFKNFNTALKDDVLMHLYEESVRGVSAFAKLDSSFHRLLSSRLDEVHFQSGAAIYKPGDVISEFFIVHQGEVTIVGKDENQTSELGRSKIFGLLENVSVSVVTMSAVATKNVTVLKIETTELYQILENLKKGVTQDGHEEYIKFHNALLLSNETKVEELDDDSPNFITNKGQGGLAYIIYKFSKTIRIFYVFLSLYSANLTSYHLAFQCTNTIFFYIVIPSELFFILKIFLGLQTGFVDEFGEFVSDSRLIRQSYLKASGFYLDFFTVMPFEVFALLADREDQLYAIGLLRMTKVFRLYNVWYFFNMRFDTLSVNMVMLKILAVAVWTATLLHQCSCFWYFVSCPKADCPDSKTWTKIRKDDSALDYLNSFYFIVNVMTTTGFGDITPITLVEILFVTALIFVSFLYTAIFIGQMVSTAQKYLFAKTNYTFRVEELRNYLHVNDVPYDTQLYVLSYVENLWRNERGQQTPELLKNAPSYLTYEIKASTYGHHINDNSIFRNCSPYFRRQLIHLLCRTVFFPGNIITYKGEVNRTAYFVHSGQVESRSDKKKTLKKIFVQNTCFGLVQCIRKHQPHTTTYYARTSCVILSLNLFKCKYLPKFYQEDLQYIAKETEKLIEGKTEKN